jgi:hypothetical protein
VKQSKIICIRVAIVTLIHQHSLINKVWPEQIARQTEQKKILEGILSEQRKK